ncbi:hypothetical protein HK104_010468 [Borealophlyctis nickersoniae]|nr:hypothetical protein HK104_010468 [Borealophlyctis nickersoniae]
MTATASIPPHQLPPLPTKPAQLAPGSLAPRPAMLVAKKIAADQMGEGPRRAPNGGLVEHTLLGDAEEFLEMERMLGGGAVGGGDEEGASGAGVAVAADVEDVNHDFVSWRWMFCGSEEGDSFDKCGAKCVHKKVDAESHPTRDQEEAIRQRRQKEERAREVREEHALKNWQRHSVEWNRVEDAIAKKSGKTKQDLLMARLGEYRAKIEDRDLVEEALLLLEQQHVSFWKTGLKIGNDLLGLTMPLPKGGARQIERLRTYEPKSAADDRILQIRHEKKQELRHVLSALDPFFSHNNGGYMEIVGHNVNVLPAHLEHLTEAYLQRLDQRTETAHSQNTHHDANNITDQMDVDDDASDVAHPAQGPCLVFAMRRLSYKTLLGEVSSSVLTVYNKGSTACRFEWVPDERPNPLGVHAVYDKVQRFFFYHKKGVILPGTAFDFLIIFKSANPGIFTEKWKLVTIPSAEEGEDRSITLQGIAIEPDANEQKRAEIEKFLERKQLTAKEIIDSILRNIKTPSRSANIKRRASGSDDEALFVARNKSLHLYYTTNAFEEFTALAADTYRVLGEPESTPWDRSVVGLNELIERIPNIDTRSAHLRRLNDAVALASNPPRGTLSSMFYVIGCDIFLELADSIANLSEGLRLEKDLPLVRSAAKFFESDDSNEGEGNKEGGMDAGRKPTPPTTGPNVGGQPAEAPKKAGGAAAAAPPPAKEAAGKKGAPAAPAAAKAPPAKAPPKGGKPVDVPQSNEQEDAPRPVVLAKLSVRPKKPDSSRAWTRERQVKEAEYRKEFKKKTHQLVHATITRMCALFEDAKAGGGGHY